MHIAKKFANLLSRNITLVQVGVQLAKSMVLAKPMFTIGSKKTQTMWISPKTDFSDFELDELFHFVNRRERTETKENTYIMTLVSRNPRQILAFAVEKQRTTSIIQKMVDSIPPAKTYHTDGFTLYRSVDFLGRHNQNFLNKSDTCRVESINADLRHYIPGLRRRSRIFYRSLETFRAVMSVFVDAYNKFGEWKYLNPNRTYKTIFDFL